VSMYGGLGDSVARLFAILIALNLVFVPLGIWKLIEICIWIYHHVSIGVKP